MSYSTDEIFEINILHCLFMNPELINELYIDEKCFISERNRKTLRFFKIIYKETRRQIKNKMISMGLNEALSYALIPESEVHKYTTDEFETVKILDPMTEERNTLRYSIIPSLYKIYEYNKLFVDLNIKNQRCNDVRICRWFCCNQARA